MPKGAPETLKKMKPASTARQGPVKQAANQAAFAGADLAAVKVELNAFRTKLIAAGLMAPDPA